MHDLAIVLLTCDRFDYATKTVEALARNLRFTGSTLLHVADDSRVDRSVEIHDLLALFTQSDRPITTSSHQTGGHSYGRSYNLATQVTHERAPHIMVIEDDWVLTQPLDVARLLRAFDHLPALGCLRLGYLGHTQELRGVVRDVAEGYVLMLDPASPERHVFAGHPRVETVEFQRAMGPWPEGLRAGQTEFEVAGRVREGVGWPMWIPPGELFGHVGTTKADPTPAASS